MKKVEILKLQNDGSQKIIATCKLIGEKVICEGQEELVNDLSSNGIINYSDQGAEKLYPQDGLLFLEQLKFNFKSGYLNATDIIEE